jgi:NAD(P)-dependent dehydrogenase (short-subunit alcohol dehydrogenase family)
MELEGQVVIVAGVGPGLGSAVVSQLASSKATVVGWARSRPHLEQLAEHAREQHWRFSPRQVDLHAQDQVDAAVVDCRERFGRIDALALTVGRWVGGATRIHELSDREWSEGLLDNVEPVFRALRRVLPVMMAQRRGAVVLVSAAEKVRFDGSASYAIAKAGLLQLTQNLAAEYRAYGVRVNAVLPGNMGSPSAPDPPDLGGALPLRTEVETAPWEVARSIVFLLSPASRWTTGAMVTVDGGSSTRAPEPPA